MPRTPDFIDALVSAGIEWLDSKSNLLGIVLFGAGTVAGIACPAAVAGGGSGVVCGVALVVGGVAYTAKVAIDHQAMARGEKNIISTLVDEARFGAQPFIQGLAWKQRAAVMAGLYLVKRLRTQRKVS